MNKSDMETRAKAIRAKIDALPVGEDLRKMIYDDLADALISEMKTGHISEHESAESAKFILERLDNVNTFGQLKAFLRELADRWTVYRDVQLKYLPHLEMLVPLETLDAIQEKYCTFCGAQNPDGFRFCNSCGKPNAAVSQVSSPASHVSIPRVRKALIDAIIEFSQRGRAMGVKSPFDIFLSNPDSENLLAYLENPTTEQVNDLVWVYNFTEEEKQFLIDNPEIYLNYLVVLGALAKAYKSIKLREGVLLAEATLRYPRILEGLAEEKDWRAYDEVATDYLSQAREVNEPFYLLQPLVKAAYAKLMLNDRRAAREYLNEFYRIVDTALRKKPAYWNLDENTYQMWIRGCKEEANGLRSKL